MRVLVTGAGGFIGSHLCQELVGHGHQVRGLDLRWQTEPDFDHLAGDITSHEDCVAAVRECDAVCHLAAMVGDWGSHAAFRRVNVDGTATVLAAARSAGVRRFVLVSSVAVHHYSGLRNATEDTPRDGHITAYCGSKIAAEDVVLSQADELEPVIVRPGLMPFGPRDRTSFYDLAQALEGGMMAYVGGGRSVLCTAYVENLVQGMRLALEHPAAAHETFVLADPWQVTWRELFTLLCRELNVRPPSRSVPFAVAYGAAAAMEGAWRLVRAARPPLLTRYRVLTAGRDCHFTSDKARRMLGYAPPVSLEEAVVRTVAWYRIARDEALG